MIYFSHILTFVIFTLICMVISKFTLKSTNRYYNFALFVSIILSSFIGMNTFLVKIFNFEIKLSIALPSILLGILIGRLNSKYSLIKKVNRTNTAN